MTSYKFTNRLIHEKSPYLQQHAHNPVEWYPWCADAFRKAADENKPVFLSIGYSTCHWCHVMEKESFEDNEIAELLNRHFIAIKVDREERPDIDNIYMLACQLMTGSGGWPLSIFMTPDKQPFFTGTYFPKENRYGRIGFKDLLNKISDAWENQKEEIVAGSEEITSALKNISKNKTAGEMDPDIHEKAFSLFEKRFDAVYGGFGTAPKFPSAHNLLFLLRYWKSSGKIPALEMAGKTLNEMYMGGIFDQLGFGFHRYSTDQKWLVPHFEKMLYDQAMLLHAYTEVFQATSNELFRNAALQIIEYVLRDMTSPDGGFFSAEDADSEGIEGKFYVWTKDEITEILGGDDSGLFCRIFNVNDNGNFHDESTRENTGSNILHLTESLENIASGTGLTAAELSSKIAEMRAKLFKKRELRVHPYKDDKILTDWNGLMISALAKAGRVFGNRDFIEAAVKAEEFINKKLTGKDGRLLHRYRDGESALQGMLDDYAFLIWAELELYESTFDPKYLGKAIELVEKTIEFFGDENGGGFFLSPSDGEELITRSKEFYDGAIPSGNSVMGMNLIRLSRITAESRYEEFAVKLLKSISESLSKNPIAYTNSLSANDFISGKGYEIIIAAEKFDDNVKNILSAISGKFIPNKVMLLVTNKNEEELSKLAPYTSNYNIKTGKPAIYVCKNHACELPTEQVEEALKLLN